MNRTDRQNIITEIISIVGPHAWVNEPRWDHLTEEELKHQLHNARAFFARRDGAARADSSSSLGNARMDSAANVVREDDYFSDGNLRPEAQRRRDRAQLGQPSRLRSADPASRDRADVSDRASTSTDEDQAKARLRTANHAMLTQPSIHRKGTR